MDVVDCLRRIRESDAEIRAWVEVSPRPPTGDGPLRGMAFGAKDIFETRGLATEYGSPLYAGRKGKSDAALVARLRSLGATLLGKTHTTAFASFDPAPTRNPRAPDRTPGGSSAGSAAAVAAGMVPFTIGSQTLGSVIRPASYCGVCGFKPTFGRLPMEGALPFAPSLDTAGLFTATAQEMRHVWEALSQAYANHDRSLDAAAFFQLPADAAMSAAAAGGAARLGALDLPLPSGWPTLVAAAHTVNRYEGARTHAARYWKYGERLGTRLAALIRDGLATSDDEYRAACAHIALMRREFTQIFAQYRFIVSPAATGAAPLGFESTGDPANNAAFTALGVPAITIPLDVAGPPLGLQITAAWGEDDALVAFAAGLESKDGNG